MPGSENQPPRLRVLLVDDHNLFRTGLRALLEEQGFIVDDVSSGDAAIRRVRAHPPDVVVMDMNMPGISGVEATRTISQGSPPIPVLMLTVASDDAQVLDAVHAGAVGYLLKDAVLTDIAAGIRAAAAGQSFIAPRIAGGLLTHLRTDHRARNAEGSDSVSLSRREHEILRLLASGCDNAEIGQRLFLSASTVKNHVSQVLRKLGVENRVQAAVYAVRRGLLDDPPTPT